MSKKTKLINHEGVGKIRIFDDKVKRGINAVEDITSKKIVEGTYTTPAHMSVKQGSSDVLIPTIVTRKQLHEIAATAYEAVQKSYGFFTELERQLKACEAKYSLKTWVCDEVVRRAQHESKFIDNIIPLDTDGAHRLAAERKAIFKRHIQDKGLNAAQRRHRDVLHARRIAEVCWYETFSLARDYRICRELEIDMEKLNEIRSRVFYLREVRALAILAREGRELINWIKKYQTNAEWIAERLGIKEEVAQEMLDDMYRQYILKKEIK